MSTTEDALRIALDNDHEVPVTPLAERLYEAHNKIESVTHCILASMKRHNWTCPMPFPYRKPIEGYGGDTIGLHDPVAAWFIGDWGIGWGGHRSNTLLLVTGMIENPPVINGQGRAYDRSIDSVSLYNMLCAFAVDNGIRLT